MTTQTENRPNTLCEIALLNIIGIQDTHSNGLLHLDPSLFKRAEMSEHRRDVIDLVSQYRTITLNFGLRTGKTATIKKFMRPGIDIVFVPTLAECQEYAGYNVATAETLPVYISLSQPALTSPEAVIYIDNASKINESKIRTIKRLCVRSANNRIIALG